MRNSPASNGVSSRRCPEARSRRGAGRRRHRATQMVQAIVPVGDQVLAVGEQEVELAEPGDRSADRSQHSEPGASRRWASGSSHHVVRLDGKTRIRIGLATGRTPYCAVLADSIVTSAGTRPLWAKTHCRPQHGCTKGCVLPAYSPVPSRLARGRSAGPVRRNAIAPRTPLRCPGSGSRSGRKSGRRATRCPPSGLSAVAPPAPGTRRGGRTEPAMRCGGTDRPEQFTHGPSPRRLRGVPYCARPASLVRAMRSCPPG